MDGISVLLGKSPPVLVKVITTYDCTSANLSNLLILQPRRPPHRPSLRQPRRTAVLSAQPPAWLGELAWSPTEIAQNLLREQGAVFGFK